MCIETPRILLVEDDSDHVELIQRSVQSGLEGVEISVARSLAEARSLLATVRPDLVLMDLRLPDGDGMDLLPSGSAGPSFPVVMITGHGDETAASETIKRGAMDYVVKGPRAFARLPQVVGRVMREWNDREARRQAAEQLLQMHQELQHVLAHTPAVIFRVRFEGENGENIVPTYTTENIERMLGCTATESMSCQWWLERLHPDDRDRVLQSVAERKSRPDSSIEYRIRHKDGAYRWVEEHTRVMYDAKGRASEVVGLWTDITPRKQADEQLRKLSRAVEQSPATIVITNHAGDIEYVNPKFTELTGYAPDEVRGKNPRVLKSGETSPEEYRRLWQAIASGHEWRGEFHNKKKNGELYWESASICPIVDDAGRITHFIGVKEDITERKRLEGELRQIQKMEAIGGLAGGIAHEFNNLLQAIQGYTRYAMDELPKESRPWRDLATVLTAADRAQSLTRQILGFGRRQAIQRRHIALNEAVTDVLKMLEPLIGENIRLKVNLDDQAGVVHADPAELHQVLLNLCVNARDAMPSGGELLLRTESAVVTPKMAHVYANVTPGQYSVLDVSDTGCGMTPEIMQHIFEPFFTTKEVGKGTGLGLATVYGIIQQHGGTIHVYSERDKGTTFRIYLPRVDAAASSGARESSGPVPGGDETILLAEDEPMVRDLTTRILTSAGYRVLAAADGDEAVRVFCENRDAISLALLDGVMPKRSGHEVYRRIKAEHPEIKGILCTGYDPEAARAEFAAEEDIRVIQKPFVEEHLLRCVREVLDEAATCRPAPTTR